MFSSANSINWGRLVPQIVYYISAYCDLIENGTIKNGDEVNVVVPTGNFGNILAAYYAKKMGIPFGKLICASNANNVLTDFLKTGTYDRNRKFFTTTSPSMDILISSILERLLYHLTDESAETVSKWMTELNTQGKYTVCDKVKALVTELFDAGCCDDKDTAETIADTYKNGYLLDTHTAVAVKVYDEYVKATGDKKETIIASTANPYKFSAAVLGAVAEVPEDADEFRQVELLRETTGEECPEQLATLKGKSPRFTDCCNKEDMINKVYDMLGI